MNISGGVYVIRIAIKGIGKLKFLVATRMGGTPVPIPNTMVKPRTADGTMLGTAWESRWLPD